MIGRRHPLPQLLEPRTAQCRAELRLPEQEALQRHGPIEEDVRQHAQLFERLKGQVLRLVDDQEHTPAVPVLSQGEIANALKQRSFSESFFGDAKTGSYQMEKVIAGELSRHDLRGDEIVSVDRRE